LPSIALFIEGDLDEPLFESLLMSFACFHPDAFSAPTLESSLPATADGESTPSALFALVRTALAGNLPGAREKIPLVPAIVRRAATGDGREATRLAARRLRASGLSPAFVEIDQRGHSVSRAAAAILFPLSQNSLNELLQQIQPHSLRS
jgi:CRISPR-associated protein Csx17